VGGKGHVPAADFRKRISRTQDNAACQNGHLDDIAVDNRLHAADCVIDQRDNADNQDHHPQLSLQTDSQHNRRGVYADAGCEPPTQQENTCQKASRTGSVALLQILVYGNQLKPPEERDEENHGEDYGKRHCKFILQPRETTALTKGHKRRHRYKADRRCLCRHGGYTGRSPGETAAPDIVVCLVFLTAPEINTEEDHTTQVHADDCPV